MGWERGIGTSKSRVKSHFLAWAEAVPVYMSVHSSCDLPLIPNIFKVYFSIQDLGTTWLGPDTHGIAWMSSAGPQTMPQPPVHPALHRNGLAETWKHSPTWNSSSQTRFAGLELDLKVFSWVLTLRGCPTSSRAPSPAIKGAGPDRRCRAGLSNSPARPPAGPRSALWLWGLSLEAAENKNLRWLEAGSHPDHILFGCSMDSAMPVPGNKRTFYAG